MRTQTTILAAGYGHKNAPATAAALRDAVAAPGAGSKAAWRAETGARAPEAAFGRLTRRGGCGAVRTEGGWRPLSAGSQKGPAGTAKICQGSRGCHGACPTEIQ